jgi:hypothetical protein
MQNLLTILSELLIHHSVIQKAEELTLRNQKDLVKKFQSKVSLPTDGELTPDTLWALQESFISQKVKLKLQDIVVDNLSKPRGLAKVTFREDAANKFNSLMAEVKEKGGIVTCSAGIREIKMVAGLGQSPTSMHYPGLAFDLNIYAGFFNPDVDTYVITKVPTPHPTDPNRFRWNVFCRSEKGEEMELEANYWESEKSGVDLQKKITGKFIDFTAIAIKHGFQPIRPLSCFTRPTNRLYICCEWWHFQANDLLIPKLSQFGMELLKIEGYTPEFLQKNNPGVWEARKLVYQQKWW